LFSFGFFFIHIWLGKNALGIRMKKSRPRAGGMKLTVYDRGFVGCLDDWEFLFLSLGVWVNASFSTTTYSTFGLLSFRGGRGLFHILSAYPSIM